MNNTDDVQLPDLEIENVLEMTITNQKSAKKNVKRVINESLRKSVLEPPAPANHCYLIYWSSLFCLSSYIQMGFIMCENTQVRYVLAAKFNWTED